MIGLYPAIYFVIDRKFGLLQFKSEALLSNIFWNIAFYTHIILGGIALLTGWSQFNNKLRIRKPSFHRSLGKIYVIAALLSSIAGIYIAFYATGSIDVTFGFICLGLIWFSTTLMAFISIKKFQIIKHEKMMIFSYAACFSAVTLRIWMPILSALLHGFIPAYRIVAWLCWIPNILVAFYLAKRREPSSQIVLEK